MAFIKKARHGTKGISACLCYIAKLTTPPVLRQSSSVHILLEIKSGHGIHPSALPHEGTTNQSADGLLSSCRFKDQIMGLASGDQISHRVFKPGR